MNADNMISQIVGRNIKKLRKEAGYTRSQFAILINKNEQQLQRYEKGVNKIDIDTLIAALKVLNVNVSAFFSQLVDDDIDVNFTQLVMEPQNKNLNAKLVSEVKTGGAYQYWSDND